MELDACKTLNAEREKLIKAQTALEYTEKALQKAEQTVTVAQLRNEVVPLFSDMKGVVGSSAPSSAGCKVIYLQSNCQVDQLINNDVYTQNSKTPVTRVRILEAALLGSVCQETCGLLQRLQKLEELVFGCASVGSLHSRLHKLETELAIL